jgi:hypothetical protein
MILLFYLVNSIKVVVEVVLRHFHGVYRSSPLLFFCGEGL